MSIRRLLLERIARRTLSAALFVASIVGMAAPANGQILLPSQYGQAPSASPNSATLYFPQVPGATPLPVTGPSQLPPPPAVVPQNDLRSLIQYTQELEKRVQLLETASPTATGTPQTASPDQPPGAGSGNPDDTAANKFIKSFFPDSQIPFTIGGQIRVIGNANNFANHSTTIGNNQPFNGFSDERLRLNFTFNANENVSAFIQMQLGSFFLGDNYEFGKTFIFPGSNNDNVGIITRRAWLAWQTEELGRFRVGIIDRSDAFGDTLFSGNWDFEPGGIAWDKTFALCNDLKIDMGAFLLADNNVFFSYGSANAYLLSLDVDQPLDAEKKHVVGFSVYGLPDFGNYSYPTLNYKRAWDTWLGARYKGETASVPWNTWVVWNYGNRINNDDSVFIHSGIAAKFEVSGVQAGPGKIYTQALFSSGGQQSNTSYSGEFRTVAQSERDNFGMEGYWGYLPMVSAYGLGASDVSDLGVSLQDRGLGLFTLQGKYDVPLCKWLTSTSAAGWLRSAIVNPTSNSNNIGTEIAQSFTIDFTGGLKLDIGGAWLFTGDFYRNGTSGAHPNDLAQLFTRLQLEF